MSTDLIDRVFVSWTEHWPIPEYVDRYLDARRIRRSEEARERVLRCLDSYRGRRPLTKSDLDYFLDANLGRS